MSGTKKKDGKWSLATALSWERASLLGALLIERTRIFFDSRVVVVSHGPLLCRTRAWILGTHHRVKYKLRVRGVSI